MLTGIALDFLLQVACSRRTTQANPYLEPLPYHSNKGSKYRAPHAGKQHPWRSIPVSSPLLTLKIIKTCFCYKLFFTLPHKHWVCILIQGTGVTGYCCWFLATSSVFLLLHTGRWRYCLDPKKAYSLSALSDQWEPTCCSVKLLTYSFQSVSVTLQTHWARELTGTCFLAVHCITCNGTTAPQRSSQNVYLFSYCQHTKQKNHSTLTKQ